MRCGFAWPALALALATASCAHQSELVPAPGAQVVPGQPRTAEETVAGVRMRVDSDAWESGRVRQVLSPVRVVIDNSSAHPLRVVYSAFSLAGPSGFRLAALPPVQVAAANPTAPVTPAFTHRGFWIASWYSRFYGHTFGVWSGPLLYDAPYYDAYYGAWPPALPDQEIIEKALPEGVLEPGGHVDGFLYFPDQPEGTQLMFLAALVDASTGQTFGTIHIPFVVK